MYLYTILKKTAGIVLSLFLLSVIVFFIARLAPGDPLVSYYGEGVERMSLEEREWALEKLGLNEPMPTQYIQWLTRACHGDLGISYKYKQDVMTVIYERIGNTILLGGCSVILLFCLALMLGIFCARRAGKMIDRVICSIGTISSCIPEFWLALVLILLFSVQLKWLPSGGAVCIGNEHDWKDRMIHLILPLTVIVSGHLWYYAYMIRNQLVEELGKDYMLLARAKGCSMRRVVYVHGLRSLLPTYLSLIAISIPHIIGGTYIVEMFFSYPGIGTLIYESARYKDYNLLMVLCILSGGFMMLCNLLSRFLGEMLDARIRSEYRTIGRETVS
ncbi:MAG: ABC transporter permease [Eubacterium sp.]|nr:ABC transporter permease [Eubacterium sp.]